MAYSQKASGDVHVRLFKYFGSNRKSILEDRLIRFSQPAVFNDPFEFLPYIESISTDEEFDVALIDAAGKDYSELYESLQVQAKLNMSKEDFHEYMNNVLLKMGPLGKQMMAALAPHTQKVLYEEWNKNVGVLCLSEKNDDLLMWAHYADSHKGFAMEFDSTSDFFNKKLRVDDSLRCLRKVKYSQKRPAIVLSNPNEEDFFLTKSSHWEYEAEWRMMIPLADATKSITVGDESICLFEFPKDAVKSITFGAKMIEAASREIMNDVAFAEGYENVQFFQAKIHPTHYKLTLEEVWPY